MDRIGGKTLVSVEEAVGLFKYTYLDDMNLARDIAQASATSCAADTFLDGRWTTRIVLTTVWNAGRVQGIREERQKRNRRQNTEAVPA